MEMSSLHTTARAIVRRMAVKTGVLAGLAALGSVVISVARGQAEGIWFIPASILCGAAIGILNFHWLARIVERIYARPGAARTAAMAAGMALTALKLFGLFIVLFVVIRWQALHILALVAGLSLSFVSILWEGFMAMLGARRQV